MNGSRTVTWLHVMFQRGQIVTVNHRVGIVVFTGMELEGNLDDHTGVWFGTLDDGKPEVVPSQPSTSPLDHSQ